MKAFQFVMRETNIWRRFMVLLVATATVIVMIFMHLSMQNMDNRKSADLIYKCNQQVSIINHIAVLAEYFNPDQLHRVDGISQDEKIQRLARAEARNELRDLSRKLLFLTDTLKSAEHIMPALVAAGYFDGEKSTYILIHEYATSAQKLSQLSVDSPGLLKMHLERIKTLKMQLNTSIDKTVGLYYQHLLEVMAQQSNSFWFFIIIAFALFAILLSTGVLKPMQRQVAKAQDEAASASRIKNEFLTSVSHEIRTPMHGIIGAGENLASTHLDNRQTDYIRTIIASAESLLDVVNDILGYSSLESGDTEVEILRFNLYELMSDLIQIMDERAQLKSLEIILRYEEGVPHEVGGDSSLIRQVLYHLLSNAIKFTEQGYIVVTVDKVEPLNTGDFALKFSVEDTGIGIPEAKQQLIFEQFVQGEGGTKRLFSGTGLGLTIVKKLVDIMEGTLKVGSVVGEGSTFSFVLPLNNADNKANHNTKDEQLLAGKILWVCDDEDYKLKVLAELGMEGMPVLCYTADDIAREATEIEDTISVVAIDYFLRSTSPIKLLQQLSLLNHFENSRYACITRKSDHQNYGRLMESGFSGVFCLPTETERFVEFAAQYHSSTSKRHELPGRSKTTSSLNYINGAKILLVEDNRINATLAEDMLLDFGAQVELAENGRIAVDKVRSGDAFDLVLMDCMMPEMDGFEATRAIRSLPQTIGKQLPIIALTANAMAGDKERCLDSGMNAYLSKPVRKKDLQNTLNRWLSHRDIAEPAALAKPEKPLTANANSHDHLQQQAAVEARPADSPAQAATHPHPTTPSFDMEDADEPWSMGEANHKAAAKDNGKPAEGGHQKGEQVDIKATTSNPPNSALPKYEPPASKPANNAPPPQGESGPAATKLSNANAGGAAGANQASSPSGATNSQLLYLDTAAVAKAKSMMKRRFATMIEYFLEDTQNYIEQINKGIENSDYSAMVVPAHTIKSSSRQMGAIVVSDLSKELEALARAEEASFEKIRELTEQLQEQFDLSRIDFNYLLSEAS